MLKRLIPALVLGTAFLAACSGNPNKAEKIETEVDKSQKVKDEEVGVKDGNMVIQRKTLMSEEVRRLQNEVYEAEDHVYGNAKYGSAGLYGVLKDCKKELAKKELGGTGKLSWQEPIDRVTDKEEKLKIGLDENDQLVGVSEEFLKDRIKRFSDYKRLLQKRQEEYQDKVDVCQNEVRTRKADLAARRAGASKPAAAAVDSGPGSTALPADTGADQ